MTYRMKMLEAHRGRLRELLGDMSRENACFLICQTAQGRDETILLVTDVVAIPPDQLLVHKQDQLSVAPETMLKIARLSASKSGSVCMIHTHPMSEGRVGFSLADDIGNQATFRFFSRLLPEQPNSCLVFDRSLRCVSGRVYTSAETWQPITCVDVVDGPTWTRSLDILPIDAEIDEQFSRHAELLGAKGQESLSKVRIGIVGCGGIGSVAALMAVHSGFRNFCLFDFDSLEKSNLPRVAGSTPSDVIQSTKKSKIVQRALLDHAPDSEVCVFDYQVEDPRALHDLVSLDVVICATDDTTSRAFLNQLCHQYYIPVLDLGVEFAADKVSGQLVKEIGKVHFMLPSTPCLMCCQEIDPRRLAEEGLTEAEKLARGEYISGQDVKQPAMMVFNTQVAARGLQHLIAWLTGLADASRYQLEHFRFFGLNSSAGIRLVRKRSNPDCIFCNGGLLLGEGDNASMLVRPRPQAVLGIAHPG